MKCHGNLHGPRLKTLVLNSLGSFFCEFEFGQIVKILAKSLCTIFEYSSFS